MAGVALNRESLKLSYCFALVTVRAIQSSMTANQREPVVMLLGALGDRGPALYGVTLFAVCAHLAAMNIGMAIGTVGPHVREDWLGVTLRTGNALVLTSQRIFC